MIWRQIVLRVTKPDHFYDEVPFKSIREDFMPLPSAMPLRSEVSSRDPFNTLASTNERRRTGRYVAGGTALAVTLLGLHQLLLRGASTIAEVCIPTIIMASYIIWVLYSARRDRRKALRLAMAMQLTEVISVPPRSSNVICKDTARDGDFRKSPTNLYKPRSTGENPAFSNKDEDV